MTGNSKNHKSPEKASPRRRFLNRLWACLGIIAAGEIVWAFFSFMRPRPSETSGAAGHALVTAGPVNGFAPDTVTAFPRGHFYLVRLADGGFLAVSRRCTHLGCTVPWIAEEKRFVCPCHSSIFDIRGAVIQSPAFRALDLFPVMIENDIVRVNTGCVIKRSGFLKEQVVYPRSVTRDKPGKAS